MEQYTYRVAWSDIDNAFIARVIEFKSLSTHGDTADKALSALRELVKVIIEDLESKGEYVPEPLDKRFCFSTENLETLLSSKVRGV